MKSLRLLSTLFMLLFCSAVTASPLYSWTTKDGTPTYSPDPPPKGVSYVIVGPDLKPLAGQPVTPGAPSPSENKTPTTTAATSSNLVLTPSPGSKSNATKTSAKSPSSKWKPVVYADDPNPTANKPKISAAVSAPVEDPLQSNQQTIQYSKECFKVRQKVLLLESQFANALTAQQMDDAIVRLNVFRNENKGNCGL